jgi:Flp pilus assembly CpaE family ATPase
LIDLNFKEGPGDVNAILGLPAMPHIGMLIDEPEDRRKGFLASLMKPTCASFAVVQPPPTIDQAERITPDDIIDLVDQARRMFQVVIIDAPADMSATTLEAIDLSTYVVLMSTGHSGSLARLNSLMTFIRKDVSKTLVLNKYPHSERKARAIAHYLDLPLAAAVDNVQDFYKLEEKGRLVDTSNCVTDIGVNGIVRNIFGFDAMIARPAKSPGSAFRAGFLKSRRAGGAVENGKGQ